MQVPIHEPPRIGNLRQICSNCHHRGHRNQSAYACKLNKCVDYTYCGIKEKHAEYQTQVNGLKVDLKNKKQVIDRLQQEIQSMENFTSHSEYHFTKNLAPRLLKVDKTYELNRVKLMRDTECYGNFVMGKFLK